MLKVEWLSFTIKLIDERLRQIFNANLPFAGIPILIAGDLRQIVPVNGKALFTISRYFDLTKKDFQLNQYGISSLSEREGKDSYFMNLQSLPFHSPNLFAFQMKNLPN